MVKTAIHPALLCFSRTVIARAAALCLLCALPRPAPSAPAAPRDQPKPEAQVKAAWLAKFLHYVQWPERAIPKQGMPMTIGFLGSDPVASELGGLISSGGYVIKGRPLAVKRSTRPDDLKSCQAVFISKSASADMKAILAVFQGSGMLTVSDMERFSSVGGMIGFRTDGDQVRFEINNTLARKEGLRIPGDLLARAEKWK